MGDKKMGRTVLPCLIVGAGPSGLSAARAISALGIDYVIADKRPDIGGIWGGTEKNRTGLYESTRLITSKEMTGFSGFQVPSNWPAYATRQLLHTYLKSFAQSIDAQRQAWLGCAVEAVQPSEKGTWTAVFSDGHSDEFSAVICASGPETLPRYDPYFAHYNGFVIHSVSYWSPSDLPAGRTLVVGSGNSSAGIALNLIHSGREVDVSIRQGRWIVPLFFRDTPSDVPCAQDLDVSGLAPGLRAQLRMRRTLLEALGDLRDFRLPLPAGLPMERASLIGTEFAEKTADGKLRVLPAITQINGRDIRFADGSAGSYSNIILATGYRSSIDYLPDALASWDRYLLGTFNRDIHGLFALGFLRSDIGGFWTRDCEAALIAKVISLLREKRDNKVRRFYNECERYSDDLSGGAKLQRSNGQPLVVYGPTYLNVLRSLGEGIEVEVPLNERWRGLHD